MSGMVNVEGVTYKMMQCRHCLSLVKVRRHRWNTFKFCSRKCSYWWKNENDKALINCEICREDFKVISCRKDTAKYCSRKCYYKSLHNRGSVVVRCACCKKSFRCAPSQHRKFCSKSCVNKTIRTRFNPKSPGCALKAMKSRGLINKCGRCGYDKDVRILGIHHKDRNRRNNHLSNLEVLCPTCHSIEHRKHIVHASPE